MGDKKNRVEPVKKLINKTKEKEKSPKLKLKVPEINLKPLSIPKWRAAGQVDSKKKQTAGPTVSKSKSINQGSSPKSSKHISVERNKVGVGRVTVRGKVNKIVRSLSHSSKNIKKGHNSPGKYLSPGKSPPRKRVFIDPPKNRSPPKKRKFSESPPKPTKKVAVKKVVKVSEALSPERQVIQEDSVAHCPTSPDSLNDLLMDSDDDSRNLNGQEEKDNNVDLTSAIEDISSPLKKSITKKAFVILHSLPLFT